MPVPTHDGRILFALRDRAAYGFLAEDHLAPFHTRDGEWRSLAHWRAVPSHAGVTLHDAIYARFIQHPEHARALVSTGEAPLLDDSLDGALSTNAYGAELMSVRAELAELARRGEWLDELVASLTLWGP